MLNNRFEDVSYPMQLNFTLKPNRCIIRIYTNLTDGTNVFTISKTSSPLK